MPAPLQNIDFIDLKQQYRRLKPAIDERIHAVLNHGQYIMGPEVAELEKRLAEYVGVRHAVGISDGTTALQVAMMALGIGPGDESSSTSTPTPATWTPTCWKRPSRRAPAPSSRSACTASAPTWKPSTPLLPAMACRSSRTAPRALVPPVTASARAACPPSAAPASSPASRWAATVTAVPASPTTTSWAARSPRSACMASRSATCTRPSASTDDWTPCRPPCCWSSWPTSMRT